MRSFLLAGVLLMAVPAALAQDAGPRDVRAEGTLVTFTLRAVVLSADEGPVPAALTQLADDANLARLDLTTRQPALYSVEAEFLFGSVADYAAWREAEQTVALLAQLQEGSPQRLESAVRFRRLALERLLPADG